LFIIFWVEHRKFIAGATPHAKVFVFFWTFFMLFNKAAPLEMDQCNRKDAQCDKLASFTRKIPIRLFSNGDNIFGR
jgi:hypothetical protein